MKSFVPLVFLSPPLLLTGCGAGPAPPPPPPHVSALAVGPQFIFLTVGGTEQLTASEPLSDGSLATPPSTSTSSALYAPCQGSESPVGGKAEPISCHRNVILMVANGGKMRTKGE